MTAGIANASERARPSQFAPAMRGKNSQKYGVSCVKRPQRPLRQSRGVDRAKNQGWAQAHFQCAKQRRNAYRETKKAEAEKIN
jgi:hypothetical protein